MQNKTAIVIGAGFSGMSAATHLAQLGWQVTVLEKHAIAGGRARQYKVDGFTFDMGPSWYWMPDVFEKYFSGFGKQVTDYYELERLDPSYRIYFEDEFIDIPSGKENVIKLFEKIEEGAGKNLEKYLKEAEYKYKVGIQKLVYKPGQSLFEFLDFDVIKGMFKLDILGNMQSHIKKYFKHEKLRKIMEFPILFLGALAKDTPALYSLMNYGDIEGGTWYPKGGMYKIVEAMYALAIEKGVKFEFNFDTDRFEFEGRKIVSVIDKNGRSKTAEVIISSADYNFTEQNLLPPNYRMYDEKYWNSRKMAPSCLLYYIGLNTKLKNILHHSLFFDTDFDTHANEIYTTKKYPTAPLFYMSAISVTDQESAPYNGENIFLLIPISAGLKNDTEEIREHYLQILIKRIQKITGQDITNNIIYKKTYSTTNFVNDYNAYKGNAYGLANTLMQTANLKPSIKNKKLKNLYYTGQLTVPGPGVPPSLISGEVVANYVHNEN